MMTSSEKVYLSLGSNIGDSCSIIQKAIERIRAVPCVEMLKISSLYQTTPVSSVMQSDFINAVCAIQTTLTPQGLYMALHQIEIALGKIPKSKEAPRKIDIDILLFGNLFLNDNSLNDNSLQIPHPHWEKRLFVLEPLYEIIKEITFPLDARGNRETLHLKSYLQTFPNYNREKIFKYAKIRSYTKNDSRINYNLA